jgi:aspartate/methionine/tyrosine aminotransferase
VLDEGELGEIAAIVRSHPRTLVISDEIYSRIVYGVPFVSPASDPRLADRTVIVDGVSKTYAMTGWRVGWAVVPPDLVPAVANVALDTFFCVSGSDQTAATEALCGPQDAARTMVATYRERRDRMIMGVNAIPGLRAHLPDGAFYAWVDARSHGMMSGELSMRLLTAAGVATYPGTAFGDAGEGFVRLTFATSEANIATGLERIASALRPAAAWRSYR